jgi:pimeloyl-ACP methyl ester carboxylesterase
VNVRSARLLSLLTMACLTSTMAAAQSSSSAPLPAAPGTMVDLGGYKLHLNCAGEGTPTVIFEAAFGGSSLDWEKVHPLAASSTRACTYDRAGLGWSETGPHARDSKSIAAELRRLLAAGDIRPPYILVAHSLGGFHARMFASLHPSEVVGMILLDASHEDQFGWRTATYWDVPRPKDLPPDKKFPEMKYTAATRVLVDSMRQQPKWKLAMERENEGIRDSVLQLRAAGSLPNIPLMVLSAGPERPLEDFWTDRELRHNQLQAKLLALSPKATLMHVGESEHFIHLDTPDLVADSVQRLVKLSRTFAATGQAAR